MDKQDMREIYSIQDCLHIIEEVLEEQLGIKDRVIEAIQKEVNRQFKYVNWIRFQHANCPGCVSAPTECDIACGRKEHEGSWKRIVAGEFQSCPARVGGTMMFDSNKPEEGLQHIDIAEHRFNVVPLINNK